MTRTDRLRACLIAGAAMLAAACNPAGEPAYLPPPPDAAEPLWAHDANADRALDQDEWAAGSDAVHARMDADGDGGVTTVEAADSFDRLDTNGDGVLTGSELYVAELDKDRNAELTRAEWRGEVFHDVFDADGSGGVSRDELHARRGAAFQSHDIDGDGVISEAEADDRTGFTAFSF